MTYIKPSELSYKWKLPLLLEAINEVLNDSSIVYSLRYSKDLDTEEEFIAALSIEKGADKDGNATYLDLSEWPSQLTWSAVKTKYQTQRKADYPDWGDQLDYIYHHGIEKWKTDVVDPVKNKYPKP